MKKIKKVLVANRGEIALRIMRTLKELDIATVAIFSDADRKALHVKMADEAYCIGPPPSNVSYLDQDKLIEIALRSGADAIHPGYGFLSENAGFAKKVITSGLIFIGPSPESIEVMGSKLAAKAAAAKYKIPMVPGGDKAVSSIDEAIDISHNIGYPVLIKASAGGGGKGMRIAEDEQSLKELLPRAISEAEASFGDGSVFIEKYIASPAHIEIQVMGDMHGNVVHLFERECSIQRRYQKVIEEAPSVKLTEEKRAAMGKAAVEVAKACGYYGAGTVEFIVDEQLNYYFLEMNTRLQVEHPVTELITGIDLVRLQLLVAEGKHLPFAQKDIHFKGHAIELRVYAEDPQNNFLPDTGMLKSYKRPQGPGVRVDDGFEEGMEIPVFYDPMIAKLIVYAEDRDMAIKRMVRCIDEYKIVGVKNTLSFGKFVIQHEHFRSGRFDTHFIKNHFAPEKLDQAIENDESEIAAAIAHMLYLEGSGKVAIHQDDQNSNWRKRRI